MTGDHGTTVHDELAILLEMVAGKNGVTFLSLVYQDFNNMAIS